MFFSLSFFEEHAVGKWKEEVSERLAGGCDSGARWLQIAGHCCGLAKLCERQKKKQERTRVFRNQPLRFVVTRFLGEAARVLRVKDHRLQNDTFWMRHSERPTTHSGDVFYALSSSSDGTLVQQSCTINYWNPLNKNLILGFTSLLKLINVWPSEYLEAEVTRRWAPLRTDTAMTCISFLSTIIFIVIIIIMVKIGKFGIWMVLHLKCTMQHHKVVISIVAFTYSASTRPTSPTETHIWV